MTQTLTLHLAKTKSQKWFISESKKISNKLDKIVTYCQGYNKIKSRLLPKSLSTLHRPKSMENFLNIERMPRFEGISTLGRLCQDSTNTNRKTTNLKDDKRESALKSKTFATSESEPLILASSSSSSSSSSTSRGGSGSFIKRETKQENFRRRKYSSQHKYGIPIIPEVLLSYSYTKGFKKTPGGI